MSIPADQPCHSQKDIEDALVINHLRLRHELVDLTLR
jgi:hypothetical protein